MKASEAEILIVPGHTNSGPEHWQSHWQSKLGSARRVEQADWLKPVREDWVQRVIDEVSAGGCTIVMVTHERDIAAHARREVTMRDGRIV